MAGRLSLKYAGAALLFAVTAGISSPAMAGFQWVAPGDAASAPPMMAPQVAPPMAAPAASMSMSEPTVIGDGPEIISPVVISGNSAPKYEAPSYESKMVEPPLVEPKMVEPKTTVKTLRLPEKASKADKGVVVGFAKSVPLAVALRQILPSGYAFSIDQDVDMGTLVSFNGGRNWRDTLRDALSPVGLTMHEQGQMVEIAFAGRGVAPIMSDAGQMPAPMPMNAPSQQPLIAPLPADMLVMPNNAMSSSAMPASESWTAERGAHLRKTLEGWARRANVEFDWMSEYDYPLEASVSFSGTFENAVRSLLTGFEGAHPQPVAELHANPGMGQMVLVVQTRGNSNSD